MYVNIINHKERALALQLECKSIRHLK